MNILERLQQASSSATPGPWTYDWGNWDVEGPRPDRYTICAMDSVTRDPPFHGQAPNPVDGPADGELIALFGTHRNAIIEALEAADKWLKAEDDHAFGRTEYRDQIGIARVAYRAARAALNHEGTA